MQSARDVSEQWQHLRTGLDRVIMGQERVKEQLLVCLLAGGHALLEGVPGTAKTLLALALSRLIGCRFRRIQFTPDLMPADLSARASTTRRPRNSNSAPARSSPTSSSPTRSTARRRAPRPRSSNRCRSAP
jgi:MoxR-like ATPase